MKKAARLVAREPVSREREILFLRGRLTFIHRLERRLKAQTEMLISLRERAERLPELSDHNHAAFERIDEDALGPERQQAFEAGLAHVQEQLAPIVIALDE